MTDRPIHRRRPRWSRERIAVFLREALTQTVPPAILAAYVAYVLAGATGLGFAQAFALIVAFLAASTLMAVVKS